MIKTKKSIMGFTRERMGAGKFAEPKICNESLVNCLPENRSKVGRIDLRYRIKD